MREQKVAPDETLVSFDISGLFTNIPVPVALEFIQRKFTEHTDKTGIENFLGHTRFIPKVISLVELVLNYCIFSFQGKFY